MTELNILKFLLIIYWIISVSYIYNRGVKISKEKNITNVIYDIITFLLAIFVGWCVFPIHLGKFLAVEILNSENRKRNEK